MIMKYNLEAFVWYKLAFKTILASNHVIAAVPAVLKYQPINHRKHVTLKLLSKDNVEMKMFRIKLVGGTLKRTRTHDLQLHLIIFSNNCTKMY